MKAITILPLCLSLSLITACNNDNDDDIVYNPNYAICGVKNPVENLDWLEEKIKDEIVTKIYVTTYNGSDYLFFRSIVYTLLQDEAFGQICDCQGNKIVDLHDMEKGDNEFSEMWNELWNSFKNEKEKWTCIYDPLLDQQE